MTSIFDSIRFPSGEDGKPIYKMLIDGEWRESSSLKTITVHDPFDGSVVGRVQKATKEDAEAAIDAAFKAKKSMADMSAYERSKILDRIADLIEDNRDEFIDVIVAEAGKPRSLAEGEVTGTVERFRFAAEETKAIVGEVVKGDNAPWHQNKIAMVMRQPLGVVMAICPFNYPLLIGTAKIAPALAAGNAVVAKPASDDPIVLFMLAKAIEEAGMPKGVFNIVSGSGSEIGDLLFSNDKIDMVSFTGSSSVGQHGAKVAGMKKIQMELGGKCPAIVLDDADIDTVVKECMAGSFKFSGQRCDALSRILIHEKIADKFVSRIKKEVAKLKMGDPRDASTSQGPLINKWAVETVVELVEDARKKGAKVLCGGKRGEGLFYEPTVLDKVTSDMRIAWEETFGPVMTIIRVKDYEEAIELANRSQYGLDSSIFTNDVDKAVDAGKRLESGTVQINGAPAHGFGNIPFGGDKESGIGREGVRTNIENMTKRHSIVFNPRYKG